MVGEWVGGVPLREQSPVCDEVGNPPDRGCGFHALSSGFGVRCGRSGGFNDPAVGRIMPVGCTGWVISNGAFLTAGHCFTRGMTTIQFNVPASAADGTTNPPPPNDQYPIDRPIVSVENATMMATIGPCFG